MKISGRSEILFRGSWLFTVIQHLLFFVYFHLQSIVFRLIFKTSCFQHMCRFVNSLRFVYN